MKDAKTVIQKLIFAAFFIFSCFSMNSDYLKGYWGANSTPFIFFRVGLIVVLTAVSTVINRKNMSFVSKFAPYCILVTSSLLIFDYYVTTFSGSQFLYRVWWIVSIIICASTHIIVVTVLNVENYKEYYNRFLRACTPLYIFLFFISFIRQPFTGRTVTLTPGKGNLPMLIAFLKNAYVSFEAPLMFFGNLAIFAPLSFILSAVFKKLKPIYILIIGLVMPFIVEGYQYIFECGNVDVDDVILNWAGFLIGFLIYRIIYKTKLKRRV